MSSIRLTENQIQILRVAATPIGGRYPSYAEIGHMLNKSMASIGNALESVSNPSST